MLPPYKSGVVCFRRPESPHFTTQKMHQLRMHTRLAIVFSTCLFGPLAAQSTGMVANVNDPLSHGQLGDSKLSLDEAIRLLNGTLTIGQLSAAESGQVVGAGAFVATAMIDPRITSTITVEQPLTPVTGSGNGEVRIEGMIVPAPPGPPLMTLLVGGNNAWILALRTHEVHVMGLHFDGGQVGVDVRTPMMNMSAGHGGMAMLHECDLHGQTSAGVLLHGAGADRSGVMLHHVHFHQMPRGIFVDDQTTTGLTMAELEHVHMDLVDLAAEQMTNGQGGAMSMLMFFRSHIDGGKNFIRARRGVGSQQQFMIRVVHCDVHVTEDALDVEGVASGLTMVHHHVSSIHAGQGFKVMHLWPKAALFDYHGTEVHMEGDVLVQANLFTQRVYQHNVHYENGTLTFDCDGSLPNFLYNKYTNCTVIVPSTARAPLRIRSSELTNTVVTGASVVAPISLEGCLENNVTLTGQSSSVNAAPAPFLAEASISPSHVPLGGTFTMTADVPANFGLLWVFTVSIERPNTVQEPFPYYGDPNSAVVLPGIHQGLFNNTVTIPNDPALVDFEAFVQPVVVPLQGQAYAAPYHLPRGGRLYVEE